MDFFEEVIKPSLKEGADPESVRSEFDQYVSKQSESFSSKLRENRDKILEEKKTLAQQFKETQDKYSFLEGKDISADSFNKMVSDLETYKSSATKDDEAFRSQLTEQYEKGKKAQMEQLEPTINSMKMKLEETSKARDDYQGKYKNYLKDSSIRQTLSKIGAEADEYWLEGFKSSSKVEYDESGDIKEIFVKHDGGHIPIEDWAKIFPQTERGKKMIKMPLSVGGGARGAGSGAGGATTLDEINNIADPSARREALAKYMGKK